MKRLLVLSILCLSVACNKSTDPVSAPVTDLSGSWGYSFQTAMNSYSGIMTITGTGKNTRASLSVFGTPVTLTGSVSETEVNLISGQYMLTGKPNNDKSRIDGTLQVNDSHYPFIAIKTP